MARSDPTRSDYCASRHLLRHLRQPRELSRNPLAHDAFATAGSGTALGTIAARVCSALRTMDGPQPSAHTWQRVRHTAILLRVDVQRHDPVSVATDLGLSSRQFHRERGIAHERFLDAYRSAISARPTSSSQNLPRQLVERAASLADSGEVASAIPLLEDVASSADPSDRCAALIHLGEIDAWSHRFDRARRRAHDARALLAAIPFTNDRYDELADGLAALDLLARWFTLGPVAVGRTKAAEDLDSKRGPRETVVRAAAALRKGEAGDALELLSRLQSFTAILPAAVVADALTLQAEIADFFGKEESVSETLFERAASLAAANGLHGRALYATHQLASTRWMHTRSALDRRAYRSLVDGIDPALSPRLRSYLIFSAADVEVAIGHPRRALQAANVAASVSTNHYESSSAQGLAAGALMRLRRIDDAGAQAAQAAESARKDGHARVLSLAQRVQALAYLSQGRRRAALAAIEESIECARRFSSTHVLAQAKAIRGLIARR